MQSKVPTALIETHHTGLRGLVARFRSQSRHRRIKLFNSHFSLGLNTRVLDLGGWDGSHINALVDNTPIKRSNVFVADIDKAAVEAARERYGFTPVLMSANDHRLNFADGFFDIVFCSSVLEHVTVPKEGIWEIASQAAFRSSAIANQAAFAGEIRRLGTHYFVQVPYRGFPIETHTWLPFLLQLPRRWQLWTIRLSNRYWIKQTSPDFYLPSEDEMKKFFPDSTLVWEKAFGLRKSMVAIRA